MGKDISNIQIPYKMTNYEIKIKYYRFHDIVTYDVSENGSIFLFTDNLTDVNVNCILA